MQFLFMPILVTHACVNLLVLSRGVVVFILGSIYILKLAAHMS